MTAPTQVEAGALPLENARWERFCQEYQIDRNAAAAYARAGYKNTKAARTCAAKLLAKANIEERLAYLERQRLEKIGMSADEVLRELQTLGTSNVGHYTVGKDGLQLAEGAPDSAMRAVQSVKIRRRKVKDSEDEIEEVEVKLWSKPAALRMAGEHHRLFAQKVETLPPSAQNETGEQIMQRVLSMVGRALLSAPAEQRLRVIRELEKGEEVA